MKKFFFVKIVVLFCMISILPVTAYAGVMIEIDGVKAYLPNDDKDAPTFVQRSEIELSAVDYQTYGNVYQADVFSVALLKKGTKICAMIPYQSVFYTDMETVKNSSDYKILNKKLQIKENPNYAPRQGYAVYELQTDLWVATGKCLNNSDFGEGGGTQYVIPLFIKQQAMYCNNREILSTWEKKMAKAA